MKLKIQLQHPNAKTPTYGTDGAAWEAVRRAWQQEDAYPLLKQEQAT